MLFPKRPWRRHEEVARIKRSTEPRQKRGLEASRMFLHKMPRDPAHSLSYSVLSVKHVRIQELHADFAPGVYRHPP
jgi:hypothetical protein